MDNYNDERDEDPEVRSSSKMTVVTDYSNPSTISSKNSRNIKSL
jgi:hypothetical protein